MRMLARMVEMTVMVVSLIARRIQKLVPVVLEDLIIIVEPLPIPSLILTVPPVMGLVLR